MILNQQCSWIFKGTIRIFMINVNCINILKICKIYNILVYSNFLIVPILYQILIILYRIQIESINKFIIILPGLNCKINFLYIRKKLENIIFLNINVELSFW